jgi:hypothetical protein
MIVKIRLEKDLIWVKLGAFRKLDVCLKELEIFVFVEIDGILKVFDGFSSY